MRTKAEELTKDNEWRELKQNEERAQRRRNKNVENKSVSDAEFKLG